VHAFIDPQSHPLVQRLESITTLSDEERAALAALPMSVRDLKADADIIREGDRPSQCCLVLDGFVCRYKIITDGKRQIMGFYIRGDAPDLLSLHIDVMDHSVGTLSASKVGFIQHEHLRELIRRYPRIGDGFWRDTLIDAALFREWMVGIGRRDAYARIAHLLCELMVKYGAVALVADDTIDLPLTQAEIGDALGVSTVHANRVIQELRANNLIRWFGQKFTVLDWEGLKAAGDFDPAYLHLKNAAA
jgi:CRP-like cAMP-binding protein